MLHRRATAARWAIALVLITACTRAERPVYIEHAAVTRDVLGADAAAYFTVRLEGTRPDAIVGLTVAEAQIASLQTLQAHRSSNEGDPGTMMMPIPRVPIGPSGTVRLTPGGYTGMLYGLRRQLAPGDSVRLTIQLASGREASAMAPVLDYADLEAALDPRVAANQPGTPPTETEGALLYRANGCASCHGETGHGDGPVGRSLAPPPRDFRVIESYRNGVDVEQIARTLAIGIPNGGSMPLFAHLSNHERRALALYLISLRTPTSSRSRVP